MFYPLSQSIGLTHALGPTMPTNIVFQNNIRYCELFGELTYEDCIFVIDNFRESQKSLGAIDFIHLKKSTVWRIGLKELRELTKRIQGIAKPYQQIYSCCLVESDVSYGMARMLSSLLEIFVKHIKFEIFRDEDKISEKILEVRQDFEERGLLQTNEKALATGGD